MNFTNHVTLSVATSTEIDANEESVREENAVLAGFFGGLVILGVASNFCLTVWILARKRLRTIQNVYVVNIAAADILLSINGIVSFLEMIGSLRTVSMEVCKFLGVMSVLPAFVVVLSTVVIARSRFRTVTRLRGDPGRRSIRRFLASQGAIWCLSMLASAPIVVGWVAIESGLFCACCFYFSDNVGYGVAISVLMYFLPAFFIAYYYARIVLHVRRSRRRVQQQQQQQQQQQHRRQRPAGHPAQARGRREGRLTAQFIVIFLVFNLCYAPAMVVFWLDEGDGGVSEAVDAFAVVLFAVNAFAMPLIFVGFNRAARDELRATVAACRPATGRRRADEGGVPNQTSHGSSTGSEEGATGQGAPQGGSAASRSIPESLDRSAAKNESKVSVFGVKAADPGISSRINPLPQAM